MKIVPKLLTAWSPLILLSDNINVVKPIVTERIKYEPEGFFITNKRTGKKILIKPKDEAVDEDKRSTYLKLQDLKKALELYKLYKEQLNYEEGVKNLQGFLTFITPSTYIGSVFNSNDKSYMENVMSGEGTGSTAGNIIIDLFTPFAIGGAKSLVTNAARYSLNVGKRMAETAMRTTPYANPISEISNNFHSMLLGNNGGKTRLFHIGKYVLTGNTTGPKGYYNSFAPFIQTNGFFTNKSNLKQKIKAFTLPEGLSYAFGGYTNNIGQVPLYNGGNDIIDAFLYGKEIAPKYGVKRIDSDYGIHNDYVNKWYPNKKVQVYEVLNNPSIPEDLITSKSSWIPSNEFSRDFSTTRDNLLNVAGHLKLTGIYNEYEVRRRLDIWKFNPTEYKQKWFESEKSYLDEPLWKKKLLDFGLRYIDKKGTPVITRTKWVYGR